MNALQMVNTYKNSLLKCIDAYNNAGSVSENIGRYRSNGCDLYNVHGNVWELTLSSFKEYLYKNNDCRNLDNIREVTQCVARGGSCYSRPHTAISFYRLPYRDYKKVFNGGFRVVLDKTMTYHY